MSYLEILFPGLFRRVTHLTPEQIPQFLLHFVPGILIGMAFYSGPAFIKDLLTRLLTTYTTEKRTYHKPALWLLRSVSALTSWFIMVTAIYAAIQNMPYMEAIDRPAQKLYTLFIFIQVGLIIGKLLKDWAHDFTAAHRKTDAARVTMIGSLVRVGHLLIWVIVFTLLLNNYGVNVSAMVAGLGVGGLAVAFAFQNILKDIFGSFSIVFDKPFVIGDFIAFGDYMGTVEEIGTKTTRLRSLSGELIVISNNDILSSRIRNYGNMYERRVVFTIRVQYGTPAAKVEKIPTIIRELLESYDDIRFDRAHFQSFTDFGLQFEAVYIVLVPDFNRMMDIQQEVNLGLYKRFEKENIRFAVPIQNMLSTVEGQAAMDVVGIKPTKFTPITKPKPKSGRK